EDVVARLDRVEAERAGFVGLGRAGAPRERRPSFEVEQVDVDLRDRMAELVVDAAGEPLAADVGQHDLHRARRRVDRDVADVRRYAVRRTDDVVAADRQPFDARAAARSGELPLLELPLRLDLLERIALPAQLEVGDRRAVAPGDDVDEQRALRLRPRLPELD